MRASSTLAAADSPGPTFTMWATTGSSVSVSWSTSGIVSAGIVSSSGIATSLAGDGADPARAYAAGPMPPAPSYDDVAAAIEPTGMIARGGFEVGAHDRDDVPGLPDGRAARTVVVVGNAGGAMWPGFRAAEPRGPDPLDRWTRAVLSPVAERFDAHFVHPSDEPFQPFQRWAQRADDVWQSPIGLLVHPEYGLWHAYRGAFLFATEVDGLPPVGRSTSPCLDCIGRPCLSTCPVDAFDSDGYDAAACAGHVRSGADPACGRTGCAARLACPVGREFRYGADQMAFHMRAFAGTLHRS